MIFALTIGLGAFLLFLVQPLLGRHLLPWFGGSPAVWTACLLFFQVLLAGGYAWARWIDARRRFRAQVLPHVGLLLASLGLLAWQAHAWASPLLPDPGFQPGGSTAPTLRILGLLAIGGGLPCLLLSASGPLLQSWFHRAAPGRSPYRLFALSNAGSLLALLTYPFAIEPVLGLRDQARAWTGLYGLFVAACGASAWIAARRGPPDGPAPRVPGAPEAGTRPSRGIRLAWLLLPACASSMLMASTNQVCQDVAVVPLLWVLPLALYLLSFIVSFCSDRAYSRAVFGPLLALASVASLAVLFRGPSLGAAVPIGVHSVALFTCCMVCHGELARLRPHPDRLTSFYLAVAIGGALGGLFVALAAPLIFCGYWELHVSLFATALAFRMASGRDAATRTDRAPRLARRLPADLFLGVFGAALVVQAADALDAPLHASRSFHGLLRVTDVATRDPGSAFRQLQNGSILHGLQPRDPARRAAPTTYYTADSGLGRAIRLHPARDANGPGRDGLRIGVIGLGVGTAAALVSDRDTLRFYEINPDVVALARGPGGYFSYLSDCPATVDVVVGDARLSIGRELDDGPPPPYDVLAVDAFTSDAIPTHLLTLEALDLYVRRLAPDGVLAFHVTNRNLRLDSVLVAAAARRGLSVARVATPEAPPWGKASTWMLLTRNDAFLERLAGLPGVDRPAADGADGARAWTDDRTDPWAILR